MEAFDWADLGNTPHSHTMTRTGRDAGVRGSVQPSLQLSSIARALTGFVQRSPVSAPGRRLPHRSTCRRRCPTRHPTLPHHPLRATNSTSSRRPPTFTPNLRTAAPFALDQRVFDAVIVGSGIGALTTATQLASKGAHVLVLERYVIPGGSAGRFQRDGYVFDVGASMIFGLGSEPGSTNLLTRALAAVDERVESVPDPVQIHYHLPDPRLDHLRVHRDYAQWLEELTQRFPHECRGIRGFYDECWAVFRALNALELLSLEEPRYLLRVFLQNPLACFTLLRYLGVNVGDVARRWIRDEALLRFIDIDCYVWSVAAADRTPMINGGMVFSDRHYGGINYPVGGVGTLAERLANALRDQERFPGCWVEYGARAVRVNVDGQRRATGVTLADGRQIRARAVISNATRWDTFGLAGADESVPRALVDAAEVPPTERLWRQWYTESPSFLSLHLGVRADALDAGHAHLRDCHHIVLEEWAHMESATDAAGTIFVSIPTVLDASVAPPGRHIFHVFTPSWMSEWRGLGHSEYRARKQQLADRLIERLERRVFPGLRRGIEVFEVGTPRTHRRFLGRKDGTYGPIAARRLHGLLTMPFNRTGLPGLYCVGDSTFPGQGLNAVAFSGFAAAHRVAVDLGLEPRLPLGLDAWLSEWISRRRLEWLGRGMQSTEDGTR